MNAGSSSGGNFRRLSVITDWYSCVKAHGDDVLARSSPDPTGKMSYLSTKRQDAGAPKDTAEARESQRHRVVKKFV